MKNKDKDIESKFRLAIRLEKLNMQNEYLIESDPARKQEILKQIEIIGNIQMSSSGSWSFSDTMTMTEADLKLFHESI